jgi:aspartyl-tRNA synthetase
MLSGMRSVFCGLVDKNIVDKKIDLCGWVGHIRDHGGVVFVDLRDKSGIVQVVFDQSISPDAYAIAVTLKNESVIYVSGQVKFRSKETINKNILTGEIEIIAEYLKVYNMSSVLPFPVSDEVNIDENLRIKYRYLDLRRDSMQKRIKLRHDIVLHIRNFMDLSGFSEIETPILTKNTPEGALEFVVPSRIKKGSFFALPQSPQMYKQLLMASGVERYFQIAKCFRDEDLRADRQFEFTQLDVEMSFVSEGEIQYLIEDLLKGLMKKFIGVEVKVPFLRMTYDEAFSLYGTDKPDLRFGMKITDVTSLLSRLNLNFLKPTADIQDFKIGAIVVNTRFSRSDLDGLLKYVNEQGGKGLLWMRKSTDGQTIESPISKFLSDGFIKDIEKIVGGLSSEDTILIVAGDYIESWEILGRLRLHLAGILNLFTEEFKFLWVTDFPLFEYNKEDSSWSSVHHPFTRPRDGWESLPLSDVKAIAYDVVLNGVELGGGSIRIHEKSLQKNIFEILGIDSKNAEERYGFLLEAQNYGFPPLGGIALGLDRLIMILLRCDSIRDVIAFPKTQSGDPLTGSPTDTSDLFLKNYGLKKIV